MNRLLLRLGFLVLPFAAFLLWFEGARGNRDTNLFIIKQRRLEALAARVEVLTLGPSHAHDGILPLLVHSNAFNLGAVSQSLYYDCALVRRYAPRLPRLRLVVLPLSYFTPEYELDDGKEIWRSYYYFRFHRISHRDWRLDTHLRNWSTWFLFGRDSGLAAVRGTLPPDIGGSYDMNGGRIDQRPETARLPHPSPDHVRDSASAATARHHATMNPASLNDNEQRLRELIPFLLAQKIGVVFVTLPVSEGYRAGQKPENMARTAQMIAGLERDFGVGHRDYSADPRFGEADFWDADHLNFAGAAKFSRLLGKEVVQPLLTRLPER